MATNDTVRFFFGKNRIIKQKKRENKDNGVKVKLNKEDFQRDELEVILQHIQFYFLFSFSYKHSAVLITFSSSSWQKANERQVKTSRIIP